MTSPSDRPLPEAVRILTAPDPRAVVLQDYGPFAESLDWAVARAYWRRFGPQAFLGGDVPYAVNNDGRSAADAAAVFLEAARDAAPDAPLAAVELGAGSGLFAKLFLDAVARADPGVHARLVYWVTDRSRAMLAALRDGPLFTGHPGARFRELDALDPGEGLDDMLAAAGAPGFHGVFANYVFDNLPMSVFYEDTSGLREMVVRSCLDRGFRPADHGFASLDALRERVAAADHDALVPLFGEMMLQAEYRPVDRAAVPRAGALDDGRTVPGVILHSHGALDCLDAVLPRLAPGGFCLVADFGTGEPREDDPGFVYNLYGGSVAVGVNFRQLARQVEGWGRRWLAPDSDFTSIRTRLAAADDHPGVAARFRELFAGERLEAGRRRKQRITELRSRGLAEQARSAFAEALSSEPDNWALLQETAYFLVYDVNEYERGRDIAREGLARNPVSPGLWTVLGAACLGLGDRAAAEEHLRRGIALNPREVRGRAHLARVLRRTGRVPEALEVLGRALALDDGEHRASLLDLQERILERESADRAARTRRAANRLRGAALGPVPPPGDA